MLPTLSGFVTRDPDLKSPLDAFPHGTLRDDFRLIGARPGEIILLMRSLTNAELAELTRSNGNVEFGPSAQLAYDAEFSSFIVGSKALKPLRYNLTAGEFDRTGNAGVNLTDGRTEVAITHTQPDGRARASDIDCYKFGGYKDEYEKSGIQVTTSGVVAATPRGHLSIPYDEFHRIVTGATSVMDYFETPSAILGSE